MVELLTDIQKLGVYEHLQPPIWHFWQHAKRALLEFICRTLGLTARIN